MSSSSPPTTATAVAAASTTTTTTTAAQQQQQHTYWCHECDMSVFLHLYPPPPPTHPRCPHCHSDFLEQMDSFTPLTSEDPHLLIPFLDPTTTTTTAFTPSDDNFLLDSPYLHRLIHHLTTTNDHFAPTPTTTTTTNRASKSALESLQDIKIDPSMLENDPIIPCPVCKDQFLLNMEVKMLPCKHMYHKDCIFPWLEMNNSCPVCRFRLPTQEDEDCDRVGGGLDNRGEGFIGGMRLEELVDDDHDFFGFGRTLRRIARRHQLAGESASGGNSLEFLLSPTQIGEVGGGVGVVARANSVETVSSWPSWPVESGNEGEVGGSGNRIGGEGDTVVRS